MNYIFNGNLKGFYCEDCYDYLYKAKIKIYAIDTQAVITGNWLLQAKMKPFTGKVVTN